MIHAIAHFSLYHEEYRSNLSCKVTCGWITIDATLLFKTQNSAGSSGIRHGHFGQKDEGEYKNSGPFIQRELVN